MHRQTQSRLAKVAGVIAAAAFIMPAAASAAATGSSAIGPMPSQRIVNSSPNIGSVGGKATQGGNRAGDLSSRLVRHGQPARIGTGAAPAGGSAASNNIDGQGGSPHTGNGGH